MRGDWRSRTPIGGFFWLWRMSAMARRAPNKTGRKAGARRGNTKPARRRTASSNGADPARPKLQASRPETPDDDAPPTQAVLELTYQLHDLGERYRDLF